MTALTDQEVRDRVAGRGTEGLGETLFVEAGAGSGKTRALVDRVEALVRHGVELRHVAAITFTEKAATELRHRIRARLTLRAATAAPQDAPCWEQALAQVDVAAIGTLHAFAQRLLSDRPLEARLPPEITVLDGVSGAVEFHERWAGVRERLLDDPGPARALDLCLVAGLRLDDLREVARAFDANWDLVAERVAADAPPPAPVTVDGFLTELAQVAGRIRACRDPGPGLQRVAADIDGYADRLRAADDERALFAVLRADTPTFRPGKVRAGTDASGEDLEQLATDARELGERRRLLVGEVLDQCLARLAAALARETLAAVEERRRRGRLAFHDLLVLARGLLRGPRGPEVRRALRARYRRLLLDEFQDTDPLQVEVAALLAAEPGADDAAGWEDLPVEPGRLFFVGDPKQSIYRFRRADMSLFLAARDRYGDPPARLTTNFRTAPGILGWVNHVFERLIAHEPGTQPAFRPLTPAPARQDPPAGPAVTLLGAQPHAEAADAEELRRAEARDVAATVTTILDEGWQVRDGDGGWRAAAPGDIAVLLPARTALPALERALADLEVPYRAETSALAYRSRVVRELLGALRAVADPSDTLALVGALRSPLFGCGDDDLVVYRRRYGGALDLLAPVPDEAPAGDVVADALRYLRRLHDESVWLAPSEVLDRLVTDRRVLELGLAQEATRDLWRRVRLLIDQARAWSQSEQGTLREYLAWAALQGSEPSAGAEPVLPEADRDAVRVMTVHAAKGLEFPVTIVSGLTSRPGSRGRGAEVAWPEDGGVALRLGRGIENRAFERYRPVAERLDHAERVRLLYVACTRAEDHLVVSLHRAGEDLPGEPARRTLAQLLAGGCLSVEEQAPGQIALQPSPHPLPGRRRNGSSPLPAFGDWRRSHAALLDRGGRPSVLAATTVAGLVLTGDDPGVATEPETGAATGRTLGRDGPGLGRAVHAVLHGVDLATGGGLDALAAAQAVAEGVAGRGAEVAALARAALASPAVCEAAASPCWRETYVATPVGQVLLEGYVDLLYRTAAGLVIVDYKTVDAGASLADRAARYRRQAAAYALAVEGVTGDRVVRSVLLFLTPDGAVEWEVEDLSAAVDDVRATVARMAQDGS